MDSEYRYRPYEGLAILRGEGMDCACDFESACCEAERALGCMPHGRLRMLALLSAAAAILQRVRDDDGVPLLLVKGGLVWQQVLGANARPTGDLDGSLRCGFDEFMERAQEAMAEPWGCLSASVEHVHAFSASTVPYDLFLFNMVISIDGGESVAFACEGSFGEPPFMLEPHAYSALALDVLGLPVPDALWGVTPARGVCDKLFNLAEPFIPEGDPAYAGRTRSYRKAKHLVDAVLLSRLCGDGGLCTLEELRSIIECRAEYDNAMRLERGFVPFARPLRVLPHEGWDIEYLVAAIQCGLRTSYEDALAEMDAFFEIVDP